VRLTSDIQGLERVAKPGWAIHTYTASSVPSRWKRNLLLLMSAFRSDHLVIHFSLPEIVFFSVFLFVTPFQRCRITTLDFFAGDIQPWLKPVGRWGLRRVSRFLVYFKDASATAQLHGIPEARFHYIPFKINGYELIRKAQLRDEGYIFSGGRSRRDFATFFAAVEGLGYPVKLLTGKESDLAPHGSSLRGLTVPPNVELLRNDSSMEYFVRLLTGARIVVIPLLRGTGTQAGIGVYLQAMAAGKCLIVSAGPGVSDVLADSQAIMVPAGDVSALRNAMKLVWEDVELRERYARAAAEYALPLGGDDELRRSVLNSLP
jgi:glycosyltransferase involved in cell wall biosynthesis